MTAVRRPRWRRGVRVALRVLVVMVIGLPVLAVATAASGFGLLLFGNLPGTVPEENPRIQAQPSYVYDSQGNQIGEFRQFDLTVPMSREDVPQVLKDATVAAEDHRFWSHKGIDPEGLVRAALTNYEQGEVVQGGSTITQQYVKAAYLSPERTFSRKFNEALLATRVERELTEQLGSARAAKEEILYRYLDGVYFGSGAYGAGAAAQTYFRKNVRDLNLSEAATLAAIIPSPSKFNPRENVFVAETRRQQVLADMLQLSLITQEQYDEARPAQLWHLGFGWPPDGQPATLVFPQTDAGASAYPYFVDYVRRYLEQRYGDEQVFKGGLRIETTIDPRLQSLAEAAVSDALAGTSYPREMSLVAVEPSTGFVKAFVGGRDWNVSQVNLGLGGETGMQAGSSFKTFTIAAALEQGFGPSTTYPGGPYNEPGCFRRANVPCEPLGGTGGDMRTATAASSNAYFVQLARDVGPNRIAEMANRLGVTTWITPDGSYTSRITLGQYSVSPLDMATGYATLANHGVRPNVTPVVKVTAADGTVLEDNTVPGGTPVLDPAIADTTTDILRGVIDGGTGRRANIGRPAAGKTGTTDNNTDIWFVGYTPQLVAAVWMGHADGQRSLGNVFGGDTAARTWAAFMRPAHDGLPVLDFPVPGPLPPPRGEGEGGTVRRPLRRAPAELPVDCGGPCVRTPSLPAPTTTTTTTTMPAEPPATTTTTGR
ncbi:transglycosylase domain-containing protein [Rhabdothermincola sp.]|uniref:transglycosylase domain-containing protein n=1 Tax=Rhabdothermincola sp. TaxID=2820405 RepID=UPI002FE13BDC